MTSARQRMQDEHGAVLVAGLLLTLAVLIVIASAVSGYGRVARAIDRAGPANRAIIPTASRPSNGPRGRNR